MFRAWRHRLRAVRPAHLAVGALACLLLLTMDGIVPHRSEAAAGASSISSVRRTQARAQAKMRRTDRKIRKLSRVKHRSQRRVAVATRRLERVRIRRDRARARLAVVVERRDLARDDRDRKLRVRPNPSGRQIVDRPTLRKRVRKLDRRVRAQTRVVQRLKRKAERNRTVRKRKASAVVRIRRRIVNKEARRERAEAVLGNSIKRMVDYAQARAGGKTGLHPARVGFRRPARGRITQGYGCQRRRKGVCTHFHDGIDIATPRGAPVRASAAGYVAYVGWNPWDEGKRAYIVILGHAGGYETIYGHLKPVRKVRTGQFVRQGQRIGLSGNTGHSTGPHVHWEVSRNFRTLDPRSV